MSGELGLSGYNGGFYVEPAGDYATTPTWLEVDATINTDAGLSKGGGQIANRGMLYKAEVDGPGELALSCTMTYRTAQKAGFDALRAAAMPGADPATIGVAVMTQDITTPGSEGWQFNAKVKNFQFPQNLEDGVEITFELVPSANSPNGVEPIWVQVA